jgi:hypothetical protein
MDRLNSPDWRLAAALFTLCVAGALTPLVMAGLLGLLLFPAGFMLAASALRGGRADAVDPAPGSVAAAWVGMVLVTVSAFRGGSLAFATTLHRLHPGSPAGAGASGSAWLAGTLLALTGAALLSVGLRQYPDCSPDRPLGWFLAAAAVFPASAVLFRVLSAWLSVTA